MYVKMRKITTIRRSVIYAPTQVSDEKEKREQRGNVGDGKGKVV